MIKLEVNDYCQECANFNPNTEITSWYASNGILKSDTTITCTHKDDCARIAKYLETHMQNKK